MDGFEIFNFEHFNDTIYCIWENNDIMFKGKEEILWN